MVKIAEILGWLQIMASPFLIGLCLGFIIYISNQNKLSLIIGVLVSLIGLFLGIIIATKIKKSKGTVNFLSKLISNTEFEKN